MLFNHCHFAVTIVSQDVSEVKLLTLMDYQFPSHIITDHIMQCVSSDCIVCNHIQSLKVSCVITAAVVNWHTASKYQ